MWGSEGDGHAADRQLNGNNQAYHPRASSRSGARRTLRRPGWGVRHTSPTRIALRASVESNAGVGLGVSFRPVGLVWCVSSWVGAHRSTSLSE